MRSAGQAAANSHNFLHWHPIPKLPQEGLYYSNPKIRDYINELVASIEAILRENRLLQKEVDKLNGKLQIYEKRFLKDGTIDSKRTSKDSHNSNLNRPFRIASEKCHVRKAKGNTQGESLVDRWDILGRLSNRTLILIGSKAIPFSNVPTAKNH